jgi:Uma2 family endonuclease
VYEQAIWVPFYGIYEVEKAAVELYELVGNRYRRSQPNAAGRYAIEALGVELGIWQGEYFNQDLPLSYDRFALTEDFPSVSGPA